MDDRKWNEWPTQERLTWSTGLILAMDKGLSPDSEDEKSADFGDYTD